MKMRVWRSSEDRSAGESDDPPGSPSDARVERPTFRDSLVPSFRCFLPACALALALISRTPAVRAAPLPWDTNALFRAPAWRAADGFSEPGVRALFFDSVAWSGRATRVFAWYGVPDLPPGAKAPAMVLVHGGGGTAFADWVRLWTARGYAAIAMNTCGCLPGGTHTNRLRHAAGGPPGWGGFDKTDEPVEDQWTYHAVAAAVLAHSLIRSFPEVDANRTGITGISWGGYLTCIVAGVDPRFRFAAPVYGCGFLGENSTWAEALRRMPPERAARWLGLWDPSVYLVNATMPMLWVTGSNDFAYPMDSLQKSYRLPKGPRTICLRVRMPHGQGQGAAPEEIRILADHLLRGGPPLPRIVKQGGDAKALWAEYASPAPPVGAEICFTRDGGGWKERKWETAPAKLDSGARRISANLPDGVRAAFLNLIASTNCLVSTEHVSWDDPRGAVPLAADRAQP